jgi:hypothetical protein
LSTSFIGFLLLVQYLLILFGIVRVAIGVMRDFVIATGAEEAIDAEITAKPPPGPSITGRARFVRSVAVCTRLWFTEAHSILSRSLQLALKSVQNSTSASMKYGSTIKGMATRRVPFKNQNSLYSTHQRAQG